MTNDLQDKISKIIAENDGMIIDDRLMDSMIRDLTDLLSSELDRARKETIELLFGILIIGFIAGCVIGLIK
jgi:hypothetical protein